MADKNETTIKKKSSQKDDAVIAPESNVISDTPKATKKTASDARKPSMGFLNKFLGTMSGEQYDFNVDSSYLSPYLPSDMVAGSIPYIAGTEHDAVWHAASQACGTEKIHYCLSIDEKKVWYLAVPSDSMANVPHSFCPLAGALPGQSEFWDKETVYLYEQEGVAGALSWNEESGRVQLFIGPSRSILPRVQSMNANFVTINPDTVKPLPWINRNLKQERLSRFTALITLVTGLVTLIVIILYLLFINMSAFSLKPRLEDVKKETRIASEKLITDSYQAFATTAPKHLVRSRELHQALFETGGILLRYELKENGSVEWQALVPQAIAVSDNPAFRSAKPTGDISDDGRVIIMGTQ